MSQLPIELVCAIARALLHHYGVMVELSFVQSHLRPREHTPIHTVRVIMFVEPQYAMWIARFSVGAKRFMSLRTMVNDMSHELIMFARSLSRETPNEVVLAKRIYETIATGAGDSYEEQLMDYLHLLVCVIWPQIAPWQCKRLIPPWF